MEAAVIPQDATTPVVSAAEKLRKVLKTPPPGTPERTEADRVRKQKSRAQIAAKKKVEAFEPDSKIECSKADALELLGERMHSEHCIQVAYELGLEAAEKVGVFPNKFFWAHGLTNVVKSTRKSPVTLNIQTDEVIPSEVIHLGDLFGIWDYSVSYREPDVTFQDFIEMRRILKSDWFELGQLLGVPLEVRPHKGWAEFLPQFVPDLRPGYSLSDMREWLGRQHSTQNPEARDFLLMAARGSMKSSAGLVFLAGAVLCAPSLRLLLCSETTDGSKKFLKAFRGIWEKGGDPAYARFQYYFPEFCVDQGEGNVKSFTSPMRHLLSVRDETAEILSMEMSAQGRRFDLAWLDDCIGKTNTGTNEVRQKGLETYGAILKLRETGNLGIVVTIGTAWVTPPPDGVGDLYFELMKRSRNSPDNWLAIKVEPAWVLKPTSAHKFPDYLNQLTEDDVESLASPNRLNFKMLIKEARFNIEEFQTQFLCQYVESEESKWTPTFTHEELYARVRPLRFFDQSPSLWIVAAVDTAFSTSMTADQSSICVAAIKQYERKNVAVVLDCVADRWKYSELGMKIIEVFMKYGVQRAVIEKNGPWAELQAAVHRAAVICGFPLPQIQWTSSKGSQGTNVSAKVKRIKGAETFMSNNQLFFTQGAYTESLFNQLIRFKGQRSGSSSGSKDDQADSLGALTSSFLVRDDGGSVQMTPEQIEMEQEAEIRKILQAQHQMYFNGSNPGQPMPVQFTPEPPEQAGGIYGALGRFGMVRD
jgi:hypothetical protein